MIVVAGEALIDLIVDQDGGITAVPGGGPYNAARTLGRLGADCTYLGVLADDRFGEQLRSGLVGAGVSGWPWRRSWMPFKPRPWPRSSVASAPVRNHRHWPNSKRSCKSGSPHTAEPEPGGCRARLATRSAAVPLRAGPGSAVGFEGCRSESQSVNQVDLPVPQGLASLDFFEIAS